MFLVVNSQAQVEFAQKVAGFGGVITGFANSYLLGLFYAVLPIIGYWFLFEKKGEPGWKAIIPIYGSYVKYKLFFKTSKWWRQFIACILLFISLIALCLFAIIWDSTRNETFSLAIIISFIVMVVSFIWLLVISIQYDISICKKYGRGIWFILGMIFFTPIFVGILAYEVYKGRAKEIN